MERRYLGRVTAVVISSCIAEGKLVPFREILNYSALSGG